MRRSVHNPAFYAYGLKRERARVPSQRSTVRLQPPRPWQYLQFFYSVEIMQLLSMQCNLTFKTCNGNVEDVRALQGNGVPTTTTLDRHVHTAWVMEFHTAGS